MGALQLHIVEPLHGARIAGAATTATQLRGELLGAAPGTLYYRWYSTLDPAATDTAQELNATFLPPAALDLTKLLALGSHVISFTATDRPGSDLASIKLVTHAGFTGGAPTPPNPAPTLAPPNPAPCVVHRLIATLYAPVASATVSRASLAVAIEAPARWCRRNADTNALELDPHYHAVNRVRFSFRVDPVGNPSGRLGASVTPEVSALTFDPATTPPRLRWQGSLGLTRTQDIGSYSFTLTVDTPDGPEKHEASVNVTLTA